MPTLVTLTALGMESGASLAGGAMLTVTKPTTCRTLFASTYE